MGREVLVETVYLTQKSILLLSAHAHAEFWNISLWFYFQIDTFQNDIKRAKWIGCHQNLTFNGHVCIDITGISSARNYVRA